MLRGNASEDGGAKSRRVGGSFGRPIDSGGQPALQRAMPVHLRLIWALLVRAPQARPPQHFLR
eukprot:11639398-Prorocentrum_lima.AAC.1